MCPFSGSCGLLVIKLLSRRYARKPMASQPLCNRQPYYEEVHDEG
jgi:hypothetical protein